MTPVTVIGLGPMGRAMAGALLAAGHPVTVWNRTAARAEPVVAADAVLAPTPSDALRAGPLVILSLTDYRATPSRTCPGAPSSISARSPPPGPATPPGGSPGTARGSSSAG